MVAVAAMLPWPVVVKLVAVMPVWPCSAWSPTEVTLPALIASVVAVKEAVVPAVTLVALSAPAVLVSAVLVPEVASPCLLYTSDAADD